MTYESNYLAHHGVKGMKWGIRRYQNPDGSLTEKGRQKIDKKIKRLKNTKQQMTDAKTVSSGSIGSIKSMAPLYITGSTLIGLGLGGIPGALTTSASTLSGLAVTMAGSKLLNKIADSDSKILDMKISELEKLR